MMEKETLDRQMRNIPDSIRAALKSAMYGVDGKKGSSNVSEREAMGRHLHMLETLENLTASGFAIVSAVPSDADVERVAVAITDEFICFSKKYWLRIARSAIAAYVGGK